MAGPLTYQQYKSRQGPQPTGPAPAPMGPAPMGPSALAGLQSQHLAGMLGNELGPLDTGGPANPQAHRDRLLALEQAGLLYDEQGQIQHRPTEDWFQGIGRENLFAALTPGGQANLLQSRFHGPTKDRAAELREQGIGTIRAAQQAGAEVPLPSASVPFSPVEIPLPFGLGTFKNVDLGVKGAIENIGLDPFNVIPGMGIFPASGISRAGLRGAVGGVRRGLTEAGQALGEGIQGLQRATRPRAADLPQINSDWAEGAADRALGREWVPGAVPGGGADEPGRLARAFIGGRPYEEATGWDPPQIFRAGEAVPRGRGAMRLPKTHQLIKSPKVRVALTEQIEAGLEIGGRDWYNTEPLRDMFTEIWGNAKGHQMWEDFMWMLGGTSPQADVMSNIRGASYYRQMLWDPTEGGRVTGKQLDEIVERIARSEEPDPAVTGSLEEAFGAGGGVLPWEGSGYGGVGRKTSGEMMVNWLNGEFNDPKNLNAPKVKSFAKGLLGHGYSMAIDTHFMRAFGMLSGNPRAWMEPNWVDISPDHLKALGLKPLKGKRSGEFSDAANYITKGMKKNDKGKMVLKYRINPTLAWASRSINNEKLAAVPTVYRSAPTSDAEYRMLEDYMNGIAKEMGITGPQAQASLWLSMAERTGVTGSSRGTFMSIFRQAISRRADELGISELEVLHQFLRSGRALSFLGAGLGITGIGAAATRETEELGSVQS